jgi:hypothetical protein
MARVLTAARCTVHPRHQGDYLKTVLGLARLGRGRGQRIWVFRHTHDATRFIEFTEAPAPLAHRALSSKTAAERGLERKLTSLAIYEEDAWELYEEQPLAGTTARDHGETDD